MRFGKHKGCDFINHDCTDEFENDWLEWQEGGMIGDEPVSNLDYWVKKVLNNSI